MLRILVISLFVANLLLFAFQRNNPAVEPETTVAPTVKKNSNIPTIHLFSEMMQDQGLLTGNRQCFSLGPFHSSEGKDEFRLLLQEVSTRINERQTEALVEKGYWVFMPPYDSLLEANQALISLQALGLEDIGVIYDGEWKSAISLGYFMRQENAQRRKESVESRGYAPQIRVQRQAEPRYWLDYEQNPGSSLIALDMQNRPNDFMQRTLPCPEEDTVEFTGEDSQQPAQVMAEVRVPVDDNEPASDRNEDPDTGGDVESAPQERVEAVPVQAVETETEDIASGSEGVIETGPENTAGTGQEDNIESVPEDAAVTGLEDTNETGAEDAAVTGQDDTIETGAEDAVETVQEVAIDTKPGSAVGTGPLDVIETEQGSAADNGSEDTLETGQEPVGETVPDDSIESGTGEG